MRNSMMKKFKRKSFGSAAAERHSQMSAKLDYDDVSPIDLSKDAAENMKFLLTEITKKDQSKKRAYLNNFSTFVRSVPMTSNFGFTLDEITACLRVALVSSAKDIRAGGLRAFRHLLVDEESLNIFMQHRLDFFIVKALDETPKKNDVERVQALRLIRKMVYLCSDLFPMSVAMSLSTITSDFSQDRDHLSRACLATLCELAVQNIKIASYCGVDLMILKNVLDCTIPRMNESLMSTVLYLLNHPQYRCHIRHKASLQPLFAPFTDFLYRHNSDIPENILKEDQANRIKSAAMACVTIAHSWAGLICLCDPNNNSIKPLLGALKLPNPTIRKALLEAFFDIFCLKKPIWTDNFDEALESVDVLSRQDSWKLSEEFLLGESEAVLLRTSKTGRPNLVQNYISLVLLSFFNAKVFESLVCVITTSDDHICIRASILLGELLHMANVLLPTYFSRETNILPSLVALSTNLNKPRNERGKAELAIKYLTLIHKMKRRGAVPHSIYMHHLLEQSKSSKERDKERDKARSIFALSWKDSDEVVQKIRESLVLAKNVAEFEMWNWDLISSLLDSSRLTLKSQDDTHLRFVKRLIQFYKPASNLYCIVRQECHLANKYSEVVLKLVDFLLQPNEQPEGEKLLLELLEDISKYLEKMIDPNAMSELVSKNLLIERLSRDYFLVIGRLTASKHGWKALSDTCGLISFIFAITANGSQDLLNKLIISTFNYEVDAKTRIFLSIVLHNPNPTTRLYATKFMRVLLHAATPFFENWGIELLAYQLYDSCQEVVDTAVSILEEACENRANLDRLIELKPPLAQIRGRGITLISRFVSRISGFESLVSRDYLPVLVKLWKTEYNCEYVNWVEMELADAFSTFERRSQEGLYVRHSSSDAFKKKDVHLMPHLYGELAITDAGIKIIIEENLLTEAIQVVKQEHTDTNSDISQLKSALWAIGHIATTELGIKLIIAHSQTDCEDSHESCSEGMTAADMLNDSGCKSQENLLRVEDFDHMENIIKSIVDMARNSPVLTIRGTCLFVLGLIASTNYGADILESYNWICVRHKGDVTWPIVEPEFIDYYESDTDSEKVPEEEVEVDPLLITGGIYMGDEDMNLIDQKLVDTSIVYSLIKFSDDKKTKSHMLDKDMSKPLHRKHDTASLKDEGFKICSYEVNENGILSERVLENQIDKLISNKVMDKLTQEKEKLFEQKQSDVSDESILTNGSSDSTKKLTKSIYHCGIYIGEEDLNPDDSIEANLSPPENPLQSPIDTSKSCIVEACEPLASIREEEKSQDSLSNSKKHNNILSAEEMEAVDSKLALEYFQDNLTDTSSQANSEERTPTQSPLFPATASTLHPHDIHHDKGRSRSISLNEHYIGSTYLVSYRSSSFSGCGVHNRYGCRHPRSGSDPGLGVKSAESVSSFGSSCTAGGKLDTVDKTKNTKVSHSRSITKPPDELDRYRSSSVLSDSSTASRTTKRLRSSTASLVPLASKAGRGCSIASDTSNANDYNLWRTQNKPRKFRGDSTSTHRSGEASLFPRRQTSHFSQSSTEFMPVGEDPLKHSKSYVGCCFPMNEHQFFHIDDYEYKGSWPEHFDEFSQEHNIQVFETEYCHNQQRCLNCSIEKDSLSPSLNNLQLPLDEVKPRSSSREDAETARGPVENKADLSLQVIRSIHNEVLKHVVNLSSAVTSKGSQQKLIAIRSEQPWAFRDLCLYSQVVEQFGMFTYRLALKRFIHSLFEAVDYSEIICVSDEIMKKVTEAYFLD